jgi:hypothetical protein
MTLYTVVLIYPDHLSSADAHQSYVSHEKAMTQSLAIGNAKARAERDNQFDEGDMNDAYVAAVFHGHLESVD